MLEEGERRATPHSSESEYHLTKYDWLQLNPLNPMNPGPVEIFMAKTPGTWSKPEIVFHATFAILHLCVAIAICSSYHVMIPFMDSIKMPHNIRYTLT